MLAYKTHNFFLITSILRYFSTCLLKFSIHNNFKVIFSVNWDGKMGISFLSFFLSLLYPIRSCMFLLQCFLCKLPSHFPLSLC